MNAFQGYGAGTGSAASGGALGSIGVVGGGGESMMFPEAREGFQGGFQAPIGGVGATGVGFVGGSAVGGGAEVREGRNVCIVVV